jgi:hypothetical protein
MRPAWNPLDAARNLFPRLDPRMVEIIQQIGASGLARIDRSLLRQVRVVADLLNRQIFNPSNACIWLARESTSRALKNGRI